MPVQSARRFTMPMVVAGLLGGHVIFILIAITLATGDRSFAVVPDYYKKAVDYDHRKVELAASAELGWRVQLQPAGTMDTVGQREVVVLLHDRDGDPISGAQVGLDCYHYARAGELLSLELEEAEPGRYVGTDRLGKEGFWQFEIAAQRGDERFVTEFKQFVRGGEAAR